MSLGLVCTNQGQITSCPCLIQYLVILTSICLNSCYPLLFWESGRAVYITFAFLLKSSKAGKQAPEILLPLKATPTFSAASLGALNPHLLSLTWTLPGVSLAPVFQVTAKVHFLKHLLIDSIHPYPEILRILYC